MTFIEKLQVIERVDALIKRKATGTAEDLAARLGVSRRCVYDIIKVMKDLDAPIEYCQTRKTFYYSADCTLAIGFVSSSRLIGGNSKFVNELSDCADFLHTSAVHLQYDASRDILRTL